MAVEEEKFDLQLVHDNFLTSLTDEDDVLLRYYLDSYYELNKYDFYEFNLKLVMSSCVL